MIKYYSKLINKFYVKYNPKKLIFSLENSSAPVSQFILLFFFSSTVRIFLELFADHDQFYKFIYPITYINYLSCFITEMMVLIVLFHLITRTKIVQITKWILASSFMINVPPIIDLLISKGVGFDYLNFFPDTHHHIFLRFFTFFGDSWNYGITPGLRLETILELTGVFIYLSIKLKNIRRIIASVLLVYIVRFSFASFPYYLKGLFGLFGISYTTKGVGIDYIFLKSNLFLIFIFGILIFKFTSNRYKEIFQILKIRSVIFCEIVIVLGIVYGLNMSDFKITSLNIMNLVLSQCSLFLSLSYVNILKFKSWNNPYYASLKLLLLISVLIISFSTNFMFGAMNLTFLALSYILYNQLSPIKLYNISIIALMFESMKQIILFLMGYTIITDTLTSLSNRIIYSYFFLFLIINTFINIVKFNFYEKIHNNK